MKKVVILGAGRTAKPIVEYLMKNNIGVIIASPIQGRAIEMINGNPLGEAVDWSMDDRETLELLIQNNDITISLLPPVYHAEVARICLRKGKPLVTTSGIQNNMQELDDEAKNAGVLLLNEMGFVPGIDHMCAMKIIDLIHTNGGVVEELFTICGALPAPESVTNPVGHRFTWSPKAAIRASLNGALYLKEGQEVVIEPEDLFRNTFSYYFHQAGELDVYPDSSSLNYAEIYGIPEAKTIYRGIFRYKGWCDTIDAMKTLNMFNETLKDYSGMTYSGFLAGQAGIEKTGMREQIADILILSGRSRAIESLDYLGFFSDEQLRYKETLAFEITSDRMIEKLKMSDNEPDMAILENVILALWANGNKEVIKTSLVDFGMPPGRTAISATTGLPAAIAARLILENRINITGVRRPVHAEIYNPVIEELKYLGIGIIIQYKLTESDVVLPDHNLR